MRPITRPRSIWDSFQQTFRSTGELSVATLHFSAEAVRIMGGTALDNLRTSNVGSVRDNAVANLVEAKDAFFTVDAGMQETRAAIAEADEFRADLLGIFLDVEADLLKDIAKSAKL